MGLTVEEIRYLLRLIAGSLPNRIGYSDDPLVRQLQAKLSSMGEAKEIMALQRAKYDKENEGP